MLRLLAWVSLFGCALAAAQPAGADRRAEIAAQRVAIDKRFAEQEEVCRQRFVVTSCLNDARNQRRADLAPLRQEELRIDTEERKQRAAARLADIEAKQHAEAARDAAPARPVPGPASAPQELPRPGARIGGGTPKPAVSAEERARREADSEAKFAQRQEEAAKHRAAVEARNAERAARGKVAKPLPIASGASAP